VILLRSISWPYFRKHTLRSVLTTAGIVLGVAVFVGMRSANESVLAAFSNTVDRIAGKTQLEVSAGDTGFGEDVLDKVQSASSVKIAVPVIEAVVDSNIKGQGNLFVLAVDMTGDQGLRDYDFDNDDDVVVQDGLVFLAQPDSIILSKDFADKNGITVGSKLPLGTVDGPKTFVVRGIMKPSGLATAYGGHLIVMDIYAAQKMFGRGRTFDRIDIAVRPGATLADCQRELKAMLGSGFQVQPPAGRGQQFEAIIASYSGMVTISSAFALFVGLFIIYNSFAIAVTERRREIGILRALGASRRRIQSLFLGESAILGLVGSAIGVIVGAFAARALAAFIGHLISDIYGVAQHVDDLSISPWVMGSGMGVGVITSLIGGAIPARMAGRVDPVRALQKGRYQVLSAGESRARIVAAALCGATSLGCLTLATQRPLFYLGYALVIVMVLLLAPLLSLVLARAIRPVLKAWRPVEGALAADSLIQAPRRTSTSVAALMLSLALIVAFAGMASASYRSIIDWMNVTLKPDLFVLPSQSLDIQTSRFPASMGPEIEAVPGVERVQWLRNGRIAFRQTPIMVVAIQIQSVAETAGTPPVAGNADEMYAKTAAGEGLMVSDNLAQLQHLQLGEMLEVAAPYGVIRLPIVGIVVDYSDQQGSILMDRSLYVRYWHDDSVNAFRVFTAPGDASKVREAIINQYSGRRQVFVLTNTELKQYILKVTDQWLALTVVQMAIAILVAILGIFNTLTVSITDRRRELGILRALGGFDGQVRRTIWMEALGIGALGLILGFAVGAINLYYLLDIVQRDIAGMRLDYTFPVSTALELVPVIFAAAFLAALWPAESAVRGSLVEALEYE